MGADHDARPMDAAPTPETPEDPPPGTAPDTTSFQDFLKEWLAGPRVSIDRTLAVFLPLMEQVHGCHEQQQVAPLDGLDQIQLREGVLGFDEVLAAPIRTRDELLRRIAPPGFGLYGDLAPERSRAHLDLWEPPAPVETAPIAAAPPAIEEAAPPATPTAESPQQEASSSGDPAPENPPSDIVTDSEAGPAAPARTSPTDATPPPHPDRPAYVQGFRNHELVIGHQDPITDVFVLGMILASLVLRLDLGDPDNLRRFVEHRGNLFRLDPGLHPVIARILEQMTDLRRERRPQHLPGLIESLRNYREQDTDIVLELLRDPGFQSKDLRGREQIILSRLQQRLFGITRRNRLLHFRPTRASLDLSQGSMPIGRGARIPADRPIHWGGSFADDLLHGRDVPLERHMDYEETSYLQGQLDFIRVESSRDQKEFGAAHLRLVVAFLEWSTLGSEEQGEEPERFDSPLLLLPVRLERRRGVQTTWKLSAPSTEAEVNPVLRHQLAQVYGLDLPETVDLAVADVHSLHVLLAQQIRASEPRINLELVDEPPLAALRHSAFQRMESYLRRAGKPTEDLPEPPPPPPGPAGDIHFRWQMDLCRVTLGNFRYRTLSLVRDYTALLQELPDNDAFRAVFDPHVDSSEPPEVEPIPLESGYPVVPMDPTQERAIAWARSGKSFIIQGPPGTGKSQTITNLIADHVVRGQRVLFVCAKRAAIDVVHRRLVSQGLEDLCCVVHDARADKRELIKDLSSSHDRFVDQGKASGPGRTEGLTALREELSSFHDRRDALHEVRHSLGCSLAHVLQRALSLRPALGPGWPHLDPGELDRLPDYRHWHGHRDALERIRGVLQDTAPQGVYRNHPLRLLQPGLAAKDRVAGEVADTVEAELPALQAIAATLEGLPEGAPRTAQELTAHPTALELLATVCERGQTDLLRVGTEAAAAWDRGAQELAAIAATVAEARENARGWRQPFPAADARLMLEQARQLDGSFFGFLKGGWWRLRKAMGKAFDPSPYPTPPTKVQALELLLAMHDAERSFETAVAALCKMAGRSNPTDTTSGSWQELVEQVQHLREAKGPLGVLRNHLTGAVPGDGTAIPGTVAASVHRAAEEVGDVLGGLQGVLVDLTSEPLPELHRELAALPAALAGLPEFLNCLKELARLPAELIDPLTKRQWTCPQLEAAMAQGAVHRELGGDRRAHRFTHMRRDRGAERIAELWDVWLDTNSRAVLEAVQARFLEWIHRQDKGVQAGLKLLRHEFGKTRAHKSVRTLGSGDSGAVLQRLKPVWLMSPLSVADTLPLDAEPFDVVIFDEASQVPLEEAVPTLFRGKQVIVVGDTMQLPPTGFFASKGDGADEDETSEEAAIGHELSSDSLLSHADRSLPSVMLGWHYRSRSEVLISYSNRAFYGGQLLTVPDERHLTAGLPELAFASRPVAPEEAPTDPTASSEDAEALEPAPPEAEERGSGQPEAEEPEAAGTEAGEPAPADPVALGTKGVLERPISFHYLQDGCYAKRRNRAEADYIARLVRSLLLARKEDPTAAVVAGSIAIVAFSQAQQTEIEAALERLAEEDRDFAFALEQELDREDDGEFVGLLVKNLENIQGDERDTVILSVCYGPDANRKVRMNFGPINLGGGEKRLNVAFSRAKHRMVVVSSMRGEEITNDYNVGAAALKGYLLFAQRCSTGDRAGMDLVLRGMDAEGTPPEAPPPQAPLLSLADALERRGYVADLGVGHSGFRCDLAIRLPDQPNYVLAVLWDGSMAADGEDPLQREVHQPGLLQAFGWRITHLLATDWWRDPDAETARIEALLQEVAGSIET